MAKKPLPFDPKKAGGPLMPDPRAGELVARASVEVKPHSLNIVLMKDGVQRVYQLREETHPGLWSAIMGTIIDDRARLDWLRADLLARIEADLADGWVERPEEEAW